MSAFEKMSLKLYSLCQLFQASPTLNSNKESSNDEAYKEQKHRAHIRKLVNAQEQCAKKIEKLEKKELSLDDLDEEDSTYIKLDRFKKRFMTLTKTINKLSNVKNSFGRKCDKKFTTEASRIPDVNEKIQALVNRERKFPDYHDIQNIYKSVNDFKSLGYGTSELNNMGEWKNNLWN